MMRFNSASRLGSLLTLLVLLSTFTAFSKVHAQYVHTDGTDIVDGNGNPVHLNGINLGNWLLWEGYLMMGDFNYRTHTQFLNSLADTFGSMAQAKEFEHQWRLNYVTEREIADLKSLGFNAVRVPFHYNLFWENGQLSDHGFQYFDRLIDYCRTHGLYVLLDMHAAPGYQNPGDHSDNMDSNAGQPRDSVKFWDGNNVQIASQVWRHIADRYKNEPVIWGYDLINEPVPQSGREYELLPSLIAMRDAIREVDNNHAIIAEGSWWASDMQKIDWTDADTQTNTGISARWDHNLVYQTHHYVFGNAGWIADLYPRADRTNAMGVPLILGEYGEDNNDIIRQLTDWSANNIAGQFPWSFKKMSHDRTLWTIAPNSIYRQVVDYINHGGTPPANAYAGMMDFAQNHIGNGASNVRWHQGFYDAIKTENQDPTPPPAGGIASGEYQIRNLASGLLLGVANNATNNGGNVIQGGSQSWQMTALGDGNYRIENNYSGLALDVQDVSSSNGANIQQWEYGGGSNQQWIVERVSDNRFRILSKLSGKSLDVQDHSTSAGGNIQQWTYHGGDNQLWLLEN